MALKNPMLKKIKLIFLLVGIILGIAGVYILVRMDFTIIEIATGMKDGFGMKIVPPEETTGFTKIIYNIGAFIPFYEKGTHLITWQYALVRIADVILLIGGLGLIIYGIFGPENEEDFEEIVQDMEEGELE